jgi:hypothetical protein
MELRATRPDLVNPFLFHFEFCTLWRDFECFCISEKASWFFGTKLELREEKLQRNLECTSAVHAKNQSALTRLLRSMTLPRGLLWTEAYPPIQQQSLENLPGAQAPGHRATRL